MLNVKALVGTFNQEKALVGASSVIVKTGCGTNGSICGTTKFQIKLSTVRASDSEESRGQMSAQPLKFVGKYRRK